MLNKKSINGNKKFERHPVIRPHANGNNVNNEHKWFMTLPILLFLRHYKDTQNMIKFEKYVIFIFSNLSVLAVDIFFY